MMSLSLNMTSIVPQSTGSEKTLKQKSDRAEPTHLFYYLFKKGFLNYIQVGKQNLKQIQIILNFSRKKIPFDPAETYQVHCFWLLSFLVTAHQIFKTLTSEVRAHSLLLDLCLDFSESITLFTLATGFSPVSTICFLSCKRHLPLQENQMGVISISQTTQKREIISYTLQLRNLWQRLRTNFSKHALLVLGFQETRASSSVHSNEWCL